jgi:hypothetical protein
VVEGVNFPPRGQILLLEAKFICRGEVNNGPQGCLELYTTLYPGRVPYHDLLGGRRRQ